MHRNDFYIFVPSDLDLWPVDLKFASPVIRVQGHISNKFEVCTTFWLRVNRTYFADRRIDKRADGVATLCAASREGRVIHVALDVVQMTWFVGQTTVSSHKSWSITCYQPLTCSALRSLKIWNKLEGILLKTNWPISAITDAINEMTTCGEIYYYYYYHKAAGILMKKIGLHGCNGVFPWSWYARIRPHFATGGEVRAFSTTQTSSDKTSRSIDVCDQFCRHQGHQS